ncbi:MAG: hypothetical protein ACYS7Y_30365, partial [Planctomycetota bacterium]
GPRQSVQPARLYHLCGRIITLTPTIGTTPSERYLHTTPRWQDNRYNRYKWLVGRGRRPSPGRGAWSVERGAWSVERGAWSGPRASPVARAWSVERGADPGRGADPDNYDNPHRHYNPEVPRFEYHHRGVGKQG